MGLKPLSSPLYPRMHNLCSMHNFINLGTVNSLNELNCIVMSNNTGSILQQGNH